MWQDLIAEYAFGFAFGLLVFQALFMRDMVGGSYVRALRMSFLPEWISMNAVMSAMVPVMVVLMTRDMRSMEPGSLRFWGVMSLASLAGFVVAYPFNVWLVAAGLKHGMGTVRALGAGGHSPALESGVVAHGTKPVMARPEQRDADAVHAATAALAPASVAATAHRAGAASAALPHAAAAGSTRGATPAQVAAVSILSVIALGAGVLLAALGGDLTMSGRMAEHEGTPATGATTPDRGPMPGMPHGPAPGR